MIILPPPPSLSLKNYNISFYVIPPLPLSPIKVMKVHNHEVLEDVIQEMKMNPATSDRAIVAEIQVSYLYIC